ncbi:MAG TPA: ComF family protein [Steroidobacteraceae bacterium]|nr:ComF family protein [Steroidobacteraceae bacterium]
MFGSAQGIVNRLRRLKLTVPRTISRALAATLFPPRCCLCGFPGASEDLDLCQHCHADLPWNRQEMPGVLAPLRFEHPVDEMVRKLKYRGAIENARVLGVLLAEAARKRDTPLPRLLVPVPLHPARLRERGFNHAFALARYAGRMLEIPAGRSLTRRVRDTPSQTALDFTARRQNVRGAFAICGPKARDRLLGAGHVAIVDDVMTTGSTAAELRAVLYAAGVSRVELWAAARAS